MKKVIFLGSLCFVLGMSSCKTYCPAYSNTETVTPAQDNATVAAPVQDDATVINS